MKVTINELMVLMKAARERSRNLENLRSEVSTRRTFGFGGPDANVVEPQFDVKKVDKKMTEIDLFLYKADALIKTTNAKTEIEIKVDVDNLLSPIE